MKAMEAQATNPNQAADIESTREQGIQIGDTAESIARIAKEVAEGSESQTILLEGAASVSNEMTASMSESTRQLESIAAFVEEIVSSVNETAASVEEVMGIRPAWQPISWKLWPPPRRIPAPSLR